MRRLTGILIAALFVVMTVHAADVVTQVDSLRISILGNSVHLNWSAGDFTANSTENYFLIRRHQAYIDTLNSADTHYIEPMTNGVVFYSVFYYKEAQGITDEIMLQDFESGTITLTGFGTQDREPNLWGLQDTITYDNSAYALRVYGNTWKVQTLSAPVEVLGNSMWGIAIYTHHSSTANPVEMNAFGIGDSTNNLFYSFRGSQLADSLNWIYTFHCVGDEDIWQFFNLPVGIDWFNVFGYYPSITKFIYVNDEDAISSNGEIFFDNICDITGDLPEPPSIWVGSEQIFTYESPGMTFQFSADAEDPDSDTLYYHWDFGEGAYSDDQNPQYTFPHTGYFTVEAEVRDETGLVDRQTIHLQVPAGVNSGEITVNFTGDCMMARRYQDPGGIIPTVGANAIWTPTLSVLGGGADLTFINLECVFTYDLSTPHPTKDYTFAGYPSNLPSLVYAGIDGVSLANNHTGDFLDIGLFDTEYYLDSLQVEHCGAGANDYISSQPMVHFADGVSVCNLGYCNRTGRIDNLPPFLEAGPNKAGFTWFTEYYLEESVPQAAELYDIVVVQVHCGTEYAIEPDTSLGGDALGEPMLPPTALDDSTTLDLQYLALDLGADLVVAHHPHVLQGYEVYNGKLIAHSMGNFAFDQDYFETFISMILYADMDNTGINNYYFRPIYIDDYIPRPASGHLSQCIIDRIADYSRDLNCLIVPDYNQNIGNIMIDPSQAISTVIFDSLTIFFPDSTAEEFISNPAEIQYDGYLTVIQSINGIAADTIEFCLGRDFLWVGNFEDEGSTIWDTENSSVSYDSFIKYSGNRSMRVTSNSYQPSESYTMLENRFVIDDDYQYTVDGYVRGINAYNANVEIYYYQARLSGGSIGSQMLSGQYTGTDDWTYFSKDLDIPNNGNYGNFRLNNSAPNADEGWAWFDDLNYIQWQNDWNITPLEIPQPNNYRFIRVRYTGEYVPQATLYYTRTRYEKE